MRAPLKFGKLKFTAPQSWEDVTVKEFVALSKWAKSTPEDLHKLWQIFSGIEDDELYKLKMKNLLALEYVLEFLAYPMDFAAIEEVKTITYEGKEITVDKELNFVTYGQFIIAQKIVKAMMKANGNKKKLNPLIVAKFTAQLAAVIIYPEATGEEFTEKGANDLAQDLENYRFVDIYPAAVFFCQKYSELNKYVGKNLKRKRTTTRLGRTLRNFLSTVNYKQ